MKLASAKETLCLRLKAMKIYENSVYAVKTAYWIHFRCVHCSATEFTRCAPIPFGYGYNSLCNFTSLNGGFSWFCGKPTKKGLTCSSYNKFAMKRYNKNVIVPNQPINEVINVPGHCVFEDTLEVPIHCIDSK